MLPRRSLLIFLSLIALVLAGCGDSKDYVHTAAPPNAVGNATVRLQSVLAQTTVPERAVSFRGTAFDSQQATVFGPETVQKAAQVEWTEVPVQATEFLISTPQAAWSA